MEIWDSSQSWLEGNDKHVHVCLCVRVERGSERSEIRRNTRTWIEMIMPLLIRLEWWWRHFEPSDSMRGGSFCRVGSTRVESQYQPQTRYTEVIEMNPLVSFGYQLFLGILQCLFVSVHFVFWYILALSRVPLDVCAPWLSNARVEAFQTLWRISVLCMDSLWDHYVISCRGGIFCFSAFKYILKKFTTKKYITYLPLYYIW